MKPKDKMVEQLPKNAKDYIDLVIRKMGYRRKVRQDVGRELEAHFADALRHLTSETEKFQAAQTLIDDFGDPKLLATLLRRGKKRCRPLWVKSLLRFAQAVGVFFLFFLLYSVWFMAGKPAIRVDYIQRLNQMIQPEIQSEDNAWIDYEKGIELYERFMVGNNPQLWDYRIKYDMGWNTGRSIARQKPKVVRDLPFDIWAEKEKLWLQLSRNNYKIASLEPDTQKTIEQWVAELEPAWRLIQSGSRKPYCCRLIYSHEAEEGFLYIMGIPHLTPLSRLSWVGLRLSQKASQEGNLDQALENCMAIIRLGTHWQGEKKLLMEQLVGMAISSRGHEGILNILRAQKLTSGKLLNIQNWLNQIYEPSFPNIGYELEKPMFLDLVQRLFTAAGPGGGHLSPKAFAEFEALHLSWEDGRRKERTDWYSIDNNMQKEVQMIWNYLPLGLVHAERTETIRKAMDFYDQMNVLFRQSPYQQHIQNINMDTLIQKDLPGHRYMLIHITLPNFKLFSDRGGRAKGEHEALMTILALKRWNLDKGEYPASLSELVAGGYLDKEPPDPYAAGSLRYEKRNKDFVLYSLGADFDDDGGVQTPDEPWGEKKDQGGDRVFWPCGN